MVLQLIVEWRFGTLSLCDKMSLIVFVIHSAPQQPKDSAARHIREHCILLDSYQNFPYLMYTSRKT